MSDLSLEQHPDLHLASTISNALCLNPDYEKQAKEKFEFLRIRSPRVRYEIDVKDLPYEVINDLESLIKNCETRQEKYERLNKIFVKSIELLLEI